MLDYDSCFDLPVHVYMYKGMLRHMQIFSGPWTFCSTTSMVSFPHLPFLNALDGDLDTLEIRRLRIFIPSPFPNAQGCIKLSAACIFRLAISKISRLVG